jgi:hypothetical protein
MSRWRERRHETTLPVIASDAKQSIAVRGKRLDCFVAALLAMTEEDERRHETTLPSLRAQRSNPWQPRKKDWIASSRSPQ